MSSSTSLARVRETRSACTPYGGIRNKSHSTLKPIMYYMEERAQVFLPKDLRRVNSYAFHITQTFGKT